MFKCLRLATWDMCLRMNDPPSQFTTLWLIIKGLVVPRVWWCQWRCHHAGLV